MKLHGGGMPTNRAPFRVRVLLGRWSRSADYSGMIAVRAVTLATRRRSGGIGCEDCRAWLGVGGGYYHGIYGVR